MRVTQTLVPLQYESSPISPTLSLPGTDILVCYSTLQGHRSFRNVIEGTWFTQILCGVLHQYGDTFDIITLLNLFRALFLAFILMGTFLLSLLHLF
ncbi:unnamed protein product [Allacma fusca]|uniref:Caspase family p10 domain-containing protein n=1 Tax=Allacma fusca TaxID=39272 RepID=A0A8J2LFT7_9HEXA|nr:unnamed protein product [Allacma fusca]